MVCTPLWWCCMQGHTQYLSALHLFQALQKWQLGFLMPFYLLSRICPNCACTQLFLVPFSFFAFCCSRRDVSRYKHCGIATKGPRSQPVSYPLRLYTLILFFFLFFFIFKLYITVLDLPNIKMNPPQVYMCSPS